MDGLQAVTFNCLSLFSLQLCTVWCQWLPPKYATQGTNLWLSYMSQHCTLTAIPTFPLSPFSPMISTAAIIFLKHSREHQSRLKFFQQLPTATSIKLKFLCLRPFMTNYISFSGFIFPPSQPSVTWSISDSLIHCYKLFILTSTLWQHTTFNGLCTMLLKLPRHFCISYQIWFTPDGCDIYLCFSNNHDNT